MAKLNTADLSISQLQDLIGKAQTELEKRSARQAAITAAVDEIKALAEKHGLSAQELNEVVGGLTTQKSGTAKSRGQVAPKYRSPDDASLTWTGRGRKPLWVASALETGKTLEDLAI